MSEPGEVYSLRHDDVWWEDDYPDWVYDQLMVTMSQKHEEPPQKVGMLSQ